MDKRLERLKKACNMDIPEYVQKINGVSMLDNGFLMHVVRGSSVLGVAHLDTRTDDKRFFGNDQNLLAWSPRIHDRMGAYIILDILPSIGVETDILLTSDHNKGDSTAAVFFGTEEYNWLYSFDLPRTGVSVYRNSSDDAVSLVSEAGFAVVDDDGYADVQELWFLGVAAYNFGNGTFSAERHSGAILRVADDQAKRFSKFYDANKDTVLDYIPTNADFMAYSRDSRLYETSPDDGPIEIYGDVYDFSNLPEPEGLIDTDTCDYCGNTFPVAELYYVPMIGDGLFLCATCIMNQDLQSYL